MLNSERRLCERDEPLLNPLFDIAILLFPGNSSRLWTLRLCRFPCESLSARWFCFTFLLFYFDVQEQGCHFGTGGSGHLPEHRIPLLNHHFFLVRVYPAFRILRRDRDRSEEHTSER